MPDEISFHNHWDPHTLNSFALIREKRGMDCMKLYYPLRGENLSDG